MTDSLPVSLPPAIAARFGAAVLEQQAPPSPCHNCNQPATAQWQRAATDEEREGYWAAIELNIRSQPNVIDDQNANYTADRSQAVTKAVFGCDEHQVADMAMVHAADCGGHGACGCGGEA